MLRQQAFCLILAFCSPEIQDTGLCSLTQPLCFLVSQKGCWRQRTGPCAESWNRALPQISPSHRQEVVALKTEHPWQRALEKIHATRVGRPSPKLPSPALPSAQGLP